APLALDGDTLYAGTETGVMLRLETDAGKIAWRRPLGGAIRAAPVPTPDGIAVATTADTLYLLDRATGAVRARLATPGAVLAGPALDGSRLYLGTTSGRLLAIELPALTVAWDLAAGDAVFGAPAVARDTVYALARNGTLWVIPARQPAAARSFALAIAATAGPTPLASGVLVASVSGEVLLVDRASGVAVAFTVMGAHEHDNSNRVFSHLLDICRADDTACRLASDGRYVNPAAEQLYQASIAYDRRAHVRLLAGQGSLLAAAGLFI